VQYLAVDVRDRPGLRGLYVQPDRVVARVAEADAAPDLNVMVVVLCCGLINFLQSELENGREDIWKRSYRRY
jgi:hypothetical protein